MPRRHNRRGVTGYNNRVACDRRNRYTTPSFHRRRCYGPRSTYIPISIYSRDYWYGFFPFEAKEDEKVEKEEKDKEDEDRITEEELEKLSVLTVKELKLNVQTNAKEHHTAKFHCTKGKDPQLVLRRGQEFTFTLTFNRAYQKDKDDLIFLLAADKKSEGKSLKAKFRLDEDGKCAYKKKKKWGARIAKMDSKTNTMQISMYSPPDCPIGEWSFTVWTAKEGEKGDFDYTTGKPLIILFNAWCKDDLVYMEKEPGMDVDPREEYVLNDSGSVYRGTANSIKSSPWKYSQYEGNILRICLSIALKAFGYKMTPAMGNAVTMSRALTKIVNSADDDGVLTGNWSGNYDGGTPPTEWISSQKILEQYEKDKAPVKYGQCWVFSHLLTTVCRALGLPCRSVTCFDSAHDTDSTCTIDCFYTEDGDRDNRLTSDSIWNFHVWNEVWIQRPDLKEVGDFNGWHAIDATPQEQSYGSFQCGPCPVKAIKEGQITVGFDTAFVFSEVNADVVHWVMHDDQSEPTLSAVKKKMVGNCLSTKPADGKPHLKNVTWWTQKDPKLRHDVTCDYKYKEGTEEERRAAKKAVTYSGNADKIYDKDDDELDVRFTTASQPLLGQDLVVTGVIENVSKKIKTIKSGVMSARCCTYFNHEESNQTMDKKKIGEKVLKPGEKMEFDLCVPVDTYMKMCDESFNVYMYLRALDENKMPYSCQEPFCLSGPELETEGPESIMDGEVATVKVWFTNPMNTPLTNCGFCMEGNLQLVNDGNKFEDFGWIQTMNYRDVQPGEKVEITISLQGFLDENDTEPEIRTKEFSFFCKEMKKDPMKATHAIQVCPKPGAGASASS